MSTFRPPRSTSNRGPPEDVNDSDLEGSFRYLRQFGLSSQGYRTLSVYRRVPYRAPVPMTVDETVGDSHHSTSRVGVSTHACRPLSQYPRWDSDGGYGSGVKGRSRNPLTSGFRRSHSLSPFSPVFRSLPRPTVRPDRETDQYVLKNRSGTPSSRFLGNRRRRTTCFK